MKTRKSPYWGDCPTLLLAAKILGKEAERLLDRIFRRVGIGIDLLAFAAGRIETVRGTSVNFDLHVTTVLLAHFDQRGTPFVGDFFVSGAMEDEDGSVRAKRLVIELPFETAGRVEDEGSTKSG